MPISTRNPLSERSIWPNPIRPAAFASGCRTRSRRSEEHTSELQSRQYLVCRLLLEKKNEKPVLIVIRHQFQRHAHVMTRLSIDLLIELLVRLQPDRMDIIQELVDHDTHMIRNTRS